MTSGLTITKKKPPVDFDVDSVELRKLVEEGGGKFLSGPEIIGLLAIAARDRKLWVKLTINRECPEGHFCQPCADRQKVIKKNGEAK